MSTAGDVALRSTVITCPNCGKKNRVPTAAKGAPRCGNCHRSLPWVVDADDDTFPQVADAATLPGDIGMSSRAPTIAAGFVK